MALLNDITRMQSEGKTEQEIISTLRQQGISAREIIDALSQSKIKEAVSGTPEPSQQGLQQEALMPSQPGTDVIPPAQPQDLQSMQMSQEYTPAQPAPMEQATQYYPQQSAQPQQEASQEYQQQQYPAAQGGISPDTITEISEQVVSEKLSPLRKDMEKIIDFRTNVDSRLEYMDERLKKIEKIIDRLNLSIMQKVGDYMSNIDDIKKELIETQKSFKALVPSLPSLGTGAKDNIKKAEE